MPFLIFQHLIEYIFYSLKVRPIFYDSLTYDKNGLCPSWFSNFLLSTSVILWRSDLYSMIVWPTTKMASAFPDFPIFDWVHFKTWFFDGRTYDKFGLWSLWFSKNDGVHFFGHILWKSDLILWRSDLRQIWPLVFTIFNHRLSTCFG